MIKKNITYKDWDNNPVAETLYFHISKSELLDNDDIRQQIENLRLRLTTATELGQEEMTEADLQELLALTKRFIRLSYGKRSEDGKRFKKSDEIWDEFVETGAYDALLFSIFETAEEVIRFLKGVIPPDLFEAAQAEVEKQQRAVPQDHKPKQVEVKNQPTQNVVFNEDTDEIRAARRRQLEAELEALEQRRT